MTDAAASPPADAPRIPLTDLGTGTYQGYEGGLYPGGGNQPPQDYLELGLARSRQVVPRNRAGAPEPTGKIGLVSIGMSNTRQSFTPFKELADEDDAKHRRVVVVNGAQGGVDAVRMMNPHSEYWHVLGQQLAQAGLGACQVQAVWMKQAIAGENRPFPADALGLKRAMAATLVSLQQHFPHLQLAYLSSRTYAGYATTRLNPEPYAYESGFAVKWLVEDAVATAAWTRARARDRGRPLALPGPWVGWGPYLWTDGEAGRSDGFTWAPEDVAKDGTHQAEPGQGKVGRLLLEFFKTEPTAAPWFLADR